MVYCHGYYYRTGTVAVRITAGSHQIAQFTAMAPSTLDSSTHRRSNLAAVLYGAQFMQHHKLLDLSHPVTLVVPDAGVVKFVQQTYGPEDNYDIWASLQSVIHQQEFHVTVPTKGDPMKDK